MTKNNWLLKICMLALLVGCATGDKDGSGAASAKVSGVSSSRLTLELPPSVLDVDVRVIGEHGVGGVVLMYGLGERSTPGFAFRNDALSEALAELSQATGTLSHRFEGYHFIYEEGYEDLLGISLAPFLEASLVESRISFSVGSGTYLYNAFNFLSHMLGKTIVGDNLISDARCGEISLKDVPVSAVLEAIMRSARVPQAELEVVSSPEYLFLGAKDLGNRLDPLKNAGADYLVRRVSLCLPQAIRETTTMPFYNEVFTLGELRSGLSEQLGVSIAVAPGLEKYPVNPCSMHDVSLENAVRLLVWQWPVSTVKCVAGVEGLNFVEAGQVP